MQSSPRPRRQYFIAESARLQVKRAAVFIPSVTRSAHLEIESQRDPRIVAATIVTDTAGAVDHHQQRSFEMSSYLKNVGMLSSAFILTGIMAGCATYGKCGIGGCADDAKMTANVRELINQQPQLGAPNSIQVQTVDRVVYLNGMVSEGLQSREAESVAVEAPGVTGVVNLIAVTH
jgi:hypothetical protein